MDDAFPQGLVEQWAAFLSADADRQPGQDVYPEVFAGGLMFPLQRPRELAAMIAKARAVNPRVVYEIGADKGGGLYHWCKCLPSVRRVVACEIRGTPYRHVFEKAFPHIEFLWIEASSYAADSLVTLNLWLRGEPIDVLFIDGDKAGFIKDFDAHRHLLNPSGIVYMHDITDPGPGGAYQEVVGRGYRHEEIIDLSDSAEAMAREMAGVAATSAHEHWLRHWKGRSCGVGMIYVGSHEEPSLHVTPQGSPRFAHCEVEICSHCDINCFACDRFIDVAPGLPMTVGQIRHFIQESLDLDWRWDRIHILGGEPTLHPQFRQVVSEFFRYRDKFPEVILRVISNGSGRLAEHRPWLLEHGVLVNVESKGPEQLHDWFSNMRMAPCDDENANIPEGAGTPCSIFGIKGCGLGITRHGIFLCGAGAAIARVIGADIGVQSLKEATYERIVEQAKTLCRLCGHWDLPNRQHAKLINSGPVFSASWVQALERYQDSKPQLSIYGADQRIPWNP